MLCCASVHGDTDCGLTNISLALESEECGNCVTINTTACAGHCQTQDPVFKSSMALITQNSCNFKEVSYTTIKLHNCLTGVEPSFTYPLALSCECSQCNTDNTDCAAVSSGPPECLVS
ncbi:GTHB1 protein, partial [Amia calva]|nr:GTHB1 protein [Amia calva]